LKVKRRRAAVSMKVTADGEGVATHAGSLLLAEMADGSGLTDGLSAAMAHTRSRRSGHDPGRVLAHLAVMLADGGDCVADLAALRHQPELFGSVASSPTAWRVVQSMGFDAFAGMERARAEARRRAWEAGAAPTEIVLDFDASLVGTHSEKQEAAPTYKGGFGFNPLLCYLDETGEALAGMLRPGNAGANDAPDHLEVLDAALAQLPVRPLGDDPVDGVAMLARSDSAGASHAFVDALRTRGITFSVGFHLTAAVRDAVLAMSEDAWVPAIQQDGEERDGAGVCELVGLDLSRWPAGTRAIARRERPHPGAQLSFSDVDGHRFQVFITDQDDDDLADLEARHRAHARVEDRIRAAKDTGLVGLPFSAYVANEAWMQLILIAQDLLAWSQRLCFSGELARAEPKTFRYRVLHTAARITRSARRTTLRISKAWPWSIELSLAFRRLRVALPS